MTYDVEVTDLGGRRCPGMWARLLRAFPWHFREASRGAPPACVALGPHAYVIKAFGAEG